ncbi:MAG: hypothetical protein ACOX5G_05675 [Kiritimatiellia bacterium]|jgi:hypothetical protein
MKKTMALLVGCAFVAALSVRADAPGVGDAVLDPSKIPAMLAAVEDLGGKVSLLEEAVSAAAELPIDPSDRLGRIAGVVSGGLDALPEEVRPGALAAMVCNIPFDLLPGAADALSPAMKQRTAAMDAEALQRYMAEAVGTVYRQGLDADAADIYAAFVIALLSAENLEPALEAVPARSHDTVRAYVAAIQTDDYAAIFGAEGAEELIFALTPTDRPFGEAALASGIIALPPISAMMDIGLERPAIIEVDKGRYIGSSGYIGSSSGPPIPPPYKGQFKPKDPA